MLKSIELSGFKSFGRKSTLHFTSPIAAIVGPNGSGKSNVAEGFRFVLGEQSMKSMRSKKGEDLIWGGSPGLSRSNRASVVITFDNRNKLLDLDFPEVSIERTVFRDGVNEYSINGTKVRLRDVAQLLSQANIGSSGYHIISQGEADRVLSASARERREMVEEALGLKAFQSKKQESEKKLEETAVNLHEASLLRREIAPHLRYLAKQVERIERAKELQDDLAERLGEYLARESAYIKKESARLDAVREELTSRLAALEHEVASARAALAVRTTDVGEEDAERVRHAEAELAAARHRREEVSRELGRAEGELSALRNMQSAQVEPGETVPKASVADFLEEVESLIARVRQAEESGTRGVLLEELALRLASFRAQLGAHGAAGETGAVQEALARVQAQTDVLEQAQKAESAAEAALGAVRASLEKAREAFHGAERVLIEKSGEQREFSARLAMIEEQRLETARLKQRFEEEVREGIVLLGSQLPSWEEVALPPGAFAEDREAQESRRRDIERLKIKIEEYRGGNAEEVQKEYEETEGRDAFLAREIEDLERSSEQLRMIIAELEENIGERFENGLALIQKEFNAFFVQLFSGGKAQLMLERARASDGEEESVPAGIGVSVQLPRKQVRGLEVLSGGERALTSIALIFAMSQVNPPPFLILDETDAALDEANSRRYASIVETLAKRSQLILITHNRATMSAAGELYGVTMGQDGVSKLLSVKLDEAVAVAK